MIPVDSVDDVLKYSLAVEDKDKFYEQLHSRSESMDSELPEPASLTT